MLSTFCRDGDATLVVRFGFTFEDSLDGAELTANLFNHLLCSATHSVHCHSAEHEGHHGTDKHTDQHDRVHQVDVVSLHEVDQCSFCRLHAVWQILTHSHESDLDLFDV